MNDGGPNGSSAVIVVAVVPKQPDAVLLQAAALARDLGGELICAHVNVGRYPVEERPDGTIVSLPFDPDLPDLSEEVFDQTLADHIRDVLATSDIRYTLRALAGEPARALGHLADATDARLIVVGTHEPGLRRGLHDFFEGSVAVHLAHRQHRPVVVVPLSPVTDDGKLPWE
jgi:nucleotide-binding universal stress UspA family protein